VKITLNWSKESTFTPCYDIETENILYYWKPEIIKTLEVNYHDFGEKQLKPAIDAFKAEQKRIEAIPEAERLAHDEKLDEMWRKENGYLATCKAYPDFRCAVGMTLSYY
jgi:hypothetical protein